MNRRSASILVIAFLASACRADNPSHTVSTSTTETSTTDSAGDVRQAPDSSDVARAPDSANVRQARDAAVESDVEAAVDVVRNYYGAINAKRYSVAYAMWGDSGRASGQTEASFGEGFAKTASVTVQPGQPGRIEGAAGSRYIDVPVVVSAVLDDGTRQRFTGAYQLRRVVVDGATAEQRKWHLYSAALQPSAH
jgi:hypothetical protein